MHAYIQTHFRKSLVRGVIVTSSLNEKSIIHGKGITNKGEQSIYQWKPISELVS